LRAVVQRYAIVIRRGDQSGSGGANLPDTNYDDIFHVPSRNSITSLGIRCAPCELRARERVQFEECPAHVEGSIPSLVEIH
jgi:hypothetical protein